MRKKALRIFAILCFILCFQPGCAMLGNSQEAKQAAPIVIRELAKSIQSWNGKTLPAYPKGQPEITILRITIPAGTRLDAHSHPVINAGVLLSGQLTVVTADGQTLHLEAGEAVVEVVNTWHYGFNEGKVPAEIVVFYAGTAGAPVTLAAPDMSRAAVPAAADRPAVPAVSGSRKP